MSHDPSEIIVIFGGLFVVQVKFLISISVENSYTAYHFCGNCNTFFQDSLMSRIGII